MFIRFPGMVCTYSARSPCLMRGCVYLTLKILSAQQTLVAYTMFLNRWHEVQTNSWYVPALPS